ncbi:hypothetical protein GIB67_004918 [Kingdonia uniflora]|uniref:FAR1 domain-containing protein n=1 Tax=Kingdonia uniflora TaxID=39325 RepID=A0A7J7LNX6_9MAGN|nr:hypothetical protein GIB67_004918 [Kingdonia uniflora]
MKPKRKTAPTSIVVEDVIEVEEEVDDDKERYMNFKYWSSDDFVNLACAWSQVSQNLTTMNNQNAVKFMFKRRKSSSLLDDDEDNDDKDESDESNMIRSFKIRMDTESETPPQSNENLHPIPVIGRTFKNEDEAYNFYNLYGRLNGFCICRGPSAQRSGSDKIVTRRVLCCSKEGQYKKHPRRSPANRRLITRTNCKARLVYKLFPNNLYHVTELHETHNHDLVLPSEVHHLRSQRSVSNKQKVLIKNMYDSGIGSTDMFNLMSSEVGGENLEDSGIDKGGEENKALDLTNANITLRNLLRKKVQGGKAGRFKTLLEIGKRKRTNQQTKYG